MLCRIGLLLLAIGVSMADSECLIIPFLITGLGAALLYIGAGREEFDTEEDSYE